MKRIAMILVLSMALTSATSLVASPSAPSPPVPPKPKCPPATEKKPVVDTYHGMKVSDDYRWLENWADPAVKAWSEEQNACTRAYLDKLPGRDALRERFTALMGGSTPAFFNLEIANGTLFAMKRQPPKQQPFLVTLPSVEDPTGARPVVDPNLLDPQGITAIDWYVPSPDGKLVAVSLSVGGSEDGTVHVYEVATGKPVFEALARVQEGTGGGSVAWDKDGKGFYYTRYSRAGERPKEDENFFQQVYHHTLGTPEAQDIYCIGKDWPRIAEAELLRSDNGDHVLATVANGDGGEYALYLLGPSGSWTRVADFKDMARGALFGPGDDLYVLSIKDAPHGKVLRVSAKEPDISKATLVVPESDVVIVGFRPTASRLYVLDMVGGPARIRIFDLAGKAAGEVPIPPVSSVELGAKIGKDDLLFRDVSYLTPGAWYLYSAEPGKTAKTALAETSPADFSDTEVIQTLATSKDGTKIPLVILQRKGTKLDGNNPALLTGYGGFGISETPGFSSARRAWIEQGGIWAIASLRGGGDFGEEWHAAGKLTRKQNVFDDFAACAQTLFDKKFTRLSRLAVTGGSNGGLLMGAELVQHPDMFQAVVSHVGIYDMLRVELSTNGAFNVTEYGTVKDLEQFKALFAYSPYHAAKKGTDYPASLFLTGANDPRVDPMQSRKFVAALQEANGSKNPILLRTNAKAGHGLDMALSERIEENADVYAFLFHQLGVTVKRPGGKKGK